MKRNFIFVLIAAMLLAPWPVVYAYDGVNADTGTPIITPADPALAPQIKPFGNTVGKVSPGDLFRIDTSGMQSDTTYELIIANADELISDYRFLNFKVGILVQNAEGNWEQLTDTCGNALPEIYISMHSGRVDFTLPGGCVYKVVIEKGCFYYYGIKTDTAAAIPVFYISSI